MLNFGCLLFYIWRDCFFVSCIVELFVEIFENSDVLILFRDELVLGYDFCIVRVWEEYRLDELFFESIFFWVLGLVWKFVEG